MLLLLQVDYVLAARGVFRFDARRVRLTLADIAGWFPTWSVPTIRRTMTKMIDLELLDAVQGQSVDRARWIGLGPAAAQLEHFTPATPIGIQASSPCDHDDHLGNDVVLDPPAEETSPRSDAIDHDDHMATRSLIVIQDSDQVKDQDHVAPARDADDSTNDDIQALWEAAKVSLLEVMSPMNHKLYIAPLQLGGVGAGTVSLVAPNGFTASGAGRYRSTIRAALIERLGDVGVTIAMSSPLHFA
jgi:hypothetical protein